MGTFGYRTLDRIDELGMTKREFYQATGITERTLRSWVDGGRTPNATSVVLVARGLGISADWLLGLTNTRREFGR